MQTRCWRVGGWGQGPEMEVWPKAHCGVFYQHHRGEKCSHLTLKSADILHFFYCQQIPRMYRLTGVCIGAWCIIFLSMINHFINTNMHVCSLFTHRPAAANSHQIWINPLFNSSPNHKITKKKTQRMWILKGQTPSKWPADEIISCLICKECKSLQIQSFSWRLLKLCLVSVLLEVSAHEQEYSLDLLYTESVMRCYDGIFVTDIGIRWPVAEEDTPVNKQVYLKLALFSLRRLYSLTCLTKLWAPFFGLLHINSSSCWLFHVCLPPELQC